jgi:hypothetical protein
MDLQRLLERSSSTPGRPERQASHPKRSSSSEEILALARDMKAILHLEEHSLDPRYLLEQSSNPDPSTYR